ncbi:PAS/PAC sensor signal transduction histidine kinase [Halorubrum aidingense JCM 13560]|uniref:PAS/PAC sensor signal transduction histidine kinase n=1 Tax=Halorubrum aidingense JCM 13560 TaxID=1230454 RepID=M0PDL2_9EURY|nr:PAS/PAC sensor signal transduction histidine kinase [Halorubrum aidingense JCM 13560]
MPGDDFFRSFVTECSDPVVSIDRDGAVVYANPATEAVLGYDPADLRDRQLTELIADDATDERVRSLRGRLDAIAGIADAGRFGFPARHADGHTVTFSVQFHEHAAGGAAADSDARVYTGVFRDAVADPADRELKTFRNLVEQAGHAIYVTDTDGTIEYVNPAFTDHTGYEPADAIGATPAILNSGEMPESYYDSLWATLRDGEVWEEEIVDRRRDGSVYHAHQTIAPVFDESGALSRFVAIQTDISERKAAMGQLKQYRDIVEQLDDPILLQNCAGEFELVNEAVSEFAGVSREELYGTDEFAFMDAETASEIDERRREVLETEAMAEYSVSPSFERSDREATFSTQRYPYYDGDGELAGTFAICRDITRLKARERDLERYERAVNGATDLIAATDRDGRFLFANPQYRAYHGIETDDVRGLTIAEVIGDERYRDVSGYVDRALRGRTVEYRTTRAHPERGTRTFDVRYYPLEHRDEEEPGGVVAVLRDVTDSVNRARQLSVVDRVLQHNLRNALTVIRGRAEQLVATDATDATGSADRSGLGSGEATGVDGADGGVDVADAASYIVARADDLLTTSEKAHHITEMLSDAPETEPVDVARTVDRLAATAAAESPNASVSVSTPDDGGAVAAATDWIDRAFDELIRNAIEHHDRERPTVEIAVRSTAEAVEVEIADDGPGLTGMNRDVLETGEAVDALYHGSGLGLWLVYWVIQQSGGSATVAARDPRGTTVTVSLPRSKRKAGGS